jgi:hypothetical protein
MKHTYITLQILIAAKMNGKNSNVKPVTEVNAVPTHYIL